MKHFVFLEVFEQGQFEANPSRVDLSKICFAKEIASPRER